MNICGSNPRTVHVVGRIHYFYWTLDAYKPFDYEPVMVHTTGKSVIVLSRFHWHITTIWTEPVIHKGKPSIHFTKFIHTPIVESSSYEWRYLDIEPTIPHAERIKSTTFYLPLFDRILSQKQYAFQKKRSYSHRIVQGRVPSRYAFRLKDIKQAVVIGRRFTLNEVPTVIKDKLRAS